MELLENLGEQSKNYHERLVEGKSLTKTHKKTRSSQMNFFKTNNNDNENNHINVFLKHTNKKNKKTVDLMKLCHIDQNFRSIDKKKSVDKETKHELNLLTLPNFHNVNQSSQTNFLPSILKKKSNSSDHSELLRNVIENRLRKTKISKLFSSFIENHNLIK